MTDHRTIFAGRGSRKRAVRVEQARRRIAANDAAAAAASACRDLVHEAGVAAVADALGLGGMLDLGGVMTAERGRALDRKGASKPVGKIDMGPAPIVIPAPGLLAADISRHIFPDRQRQFGADLIGGVL